MTTLRTIAAICFSSVLALSACSGKAGGGPGDGPDGGDNPGDPDGGGNKPPDAGIDTDGDGVPDHIELENGTNPNSPDSDGDGLTDGEELDYGTNPNNPDSDGDGLTDGEEVDIIGTNPANPGCENQSAEASSSSQPADIIIMVDTSSSMRQEIDAIETNLNTDLAEILNTAKVDYRIILVADFPPTESGGEVEATNPPICIGQPLANQDCAAIPAGQLKPVNPDLNAGGRFVHYDQHVDSTDGLVVMLREFDDPTGDLGTTAGSASAGAQYPGGWGQFLREDALRIFMFITDDDANGVDDEQFHTDFTAKLSARFAGGTPELRYIAHSILGIPVKPDGTVWLPADPLQDQECDPAFADGIGEDYQRLSVNTGGLRFSLCNVNDTIPGNDDFNEIFNAVADNVKNETRLPCAFTPAAPEPGEPNLNYDGAKLIYRPGTGSLELFNEVPDASMCGTTPSGFFKTGTDEAPTFELCPATCDRVEVDLQGKINLLIDCEIQIG